MADDDQIAPTDAGPPWGPPWGVLEAVFALSAFFLVQGVVVLLIGPDLTDSGRGLAASAAGQVAGLAAVLIFMFMWIGRSRSPLRSLGFRVPRASDVLASWWILVLGAVTYVAASIGLGMLMEQMGLGPEDLPRQDLVETIRATDSSTVLALSVMVAVVIAPVAEEVLFRSVIYQPLRRRFGRTTAALLVSLLFATVHFYAFGVVHLVIISLVLVGLFERTRSLWVSIAAHAAYNAFTMALARSSHFAP